MPVPAEVNAEEDGAAAAEYEEPLDASAALTLDKPSKRNLPIHNREHLRTSFLAGERAYCWR